LKKSKNFENLKMPSFAASASQHLNVKIKNTGGFGGSSYGAGNADRLLKHYNSQGSTDHFE